jgi:hypothetical protein
MFSIFLWTFAYFSGVCRRDWETVDWDETRKDALAKGITDPDTKMNDFMAKWYGTDTSAREHRSVMTSFHRVKAQATACGRP